MECSSQTAQQSLFLTQFITNMRPQLTSNSFILTNSETNKKYAISQSLIFKEYILIEHKFRTEITKGVVDSSRGIEIELTKSIFNKYKVHILNLNTEKLIGEDSFACNTESEIQERNLSSEQLTHIVVGLNNHKLFFNLLKNGRCEEAASWIKRGIDLTPPKGYLPALSYALMHDNEELIKLLLKTKPDCLTLVPISQLTCGTRAQRNANPKIYILYSALSKDGTVHKHAQTVAEEMIEQAILQGKVNQKDHYQISPLRLMVRFGYLDLAVKLIENDADVNCRDWQYWTPLHCAAATGQTEAVEKLLTHPKTNKVINPLLLTDDEKLPSELVDDKTGELFKRLQEAELSAFDKIKKEYESESDTSQQEKLKPNYDKYLLKFEKLYPSKFSKLDVAEGENEWMLVILKTNSNDN